MKVSIYGEIIKNDPSETIIKDLDTSETYSVIWSGDEFYKNKEGTVGFYIGEMRGSKVYLKAFEERTLIKPLEEEVLKKASALYDTGTLLNDKFPYIAKKLQEKDESKSN
jgi:hypothetical protein